MSARDSNEPGLRKRQQMATREQIIDKAMELYASGAEIVSHEIIAREANMSSRTVYRHFPDRAALMQAIWQRLRILTGIRFPAVEQEIVPLAREAFASLDRHARLVNAVMASVAGAQLQRLPANEGTAAFSRSLAPLLQGLTGAERKRCVAVCVAIYSAPFWQLLRERGGLSGRETQESAAWLLEVILDALRTHASQSNRKKKPR